MPLLRGCCSLDLKIGTKVIGIVFLILNLVCFSLSVICLLAILMMQDILIEYLVPVIQDGLQGQMINGTEVGDHNIDEHTKEVVDALENNIDIVTIAILVIACQQLLDLICSSLVVHGIRKNRRGMLLPWVLTHVVYFIIELGFVVVLLVGSVYVSNFVHVFLPAVAISLMWMALHLYLILVVISQYQALGLIRMHEDEMCLK